MISSGDCLESRDHERDQSPLAPVLAVGAKAPQAAPPPSPKAGRSRWTRCFAWTDTKLPLSPFASWWPGRR